MHVQADPEPLRVVKPADQSVHYKQQVNVRFLEPPPAPEPAPIIIKVIKREMIVFLQYEKYTCLIVKIQSRNDKLQRHLQHHLWSFVNVHQHHQHLLHLLFVRFIFFMIIFTSHDEFEYQANDHLHHQCNNNRK